MCQGTLSPTHYFVVYGTTGLKPDIIKKISYKLTHTYYNWPSTVQVPAPCQYGHNPAQQVNEHIHKEPSVKLCDRLLYLGRHSYYATFRPACSFRGITIVLQYALVSRCTTKTAFITLLVEQSNRMASPPLLLFYPGRLKPYRVLLQVSLARDSYLLPVHRESSNNIQGVNIYNSSSSTIPTTTPVFRRHEPMSNTANQGSAQNTQILMFQGTVNIVSYATLLGRPTSTLPAPSLNPITTGFFLANMS